MGAENVSRIAKSFGLTFDAFQAPDAEFTPLTLAQAYGIFAAEGVMYGQDFDGKLASTTLLTVQDADGKLWLDWREAKSQPVVTPELAFLMTDILSDGAARWESLGTRNALEVGLPAAAKIGQRADFSAEWTLGYSPLRVAVVWLGADEALPPQSSAGIWHALIKSASAALPPTSWDTPAEITVMDVCEPSGLLPTIDCPNIVEEVFLNGSEPSQYDNLHRSFEVNRETGFLATVFTPPELVEKHQYLLPPAEAQSWAEAVGLPAPPASYDAIVAPPRVEDAYIAAPDFFDDVRGVVDIRGTAAGEGFVHYRVQVGQGLNPQRWTVVGEDIDGTIHNNTLAVWDASELSGLYAIQLLVVYEDQRVEISTTQVSVDNEAPTVKIIFPQNDEKLEYAKNRQIEFQIDAEDNLGIEKVEIYLNLRQITILTEAPYLWTWASSKGEHTLRLRVYDRAGNMTEETARFIVV